MASESEADTRKLRIDPRMPAVLAETFRGESVPERTATAVEGWGKYQDA